MLWILIACLSAFLMGIVNVFDKIIPTKFSSHYKTYPLSIGIIGLPITLLLLIAVIPFSHTTLSGVMLIILSGCLFGLHATIILRALYATEASRLFPVVHTHPLFTAFIAFFLLGEFLSLFQWIAILIIMSGVVVISINPSKGRSGNGLLLKALLPIVVSSAILGTSNAVLKPALESSSVILTHAIRLIILFLILIAFNLNKTTWADITVWWRQKKGALRLVTTNELIAQVALIASVWAISLGPVSLVSAILSASGLVTVATVLILGKYVNSIVNEDITLSSISFKICGTLFIIIGVIVITLTGTS
ncbi:MAG: Uncharacterised protein [Chloroflexota bacterium]|nr:hypothetical protein [SAR202 cluster bacterium]CAI8368371.1 MAG: Uncharacterised protein [Chloroflexota bacterium]